MSGRAWHHRDRDLFAQTVQEVAAEYPDLRLSVRNGLVYCTGSFLLLKAGQEVDRYEIEVKLPADFPAGVPTVYERAGRIPRIADHHRNRDGSVCLFAPGERWRYWPEGAGLVEFLRGPVQAYFVGHAIYELTGKWPFGERSHGAAGIFEAYSDLLGTEDQRTIVRYLDALARRKLAPHRACPCGSGRSLSRCHRDAVVALRRKVRWKEARQALVSVFLEHPALSRASRLKRIRRGV